MQGLDLVSEGCGDLRKVLVDVGLSTLGLFLRQEEDRADHAVFPSRSVWLSLAPGLDCTEPSA